VLESVEAFGDVCIQDVFRLLVDAFVDGFDRVVAGPSGAESVTVGFEVGFPFRFQRKGCERLLRSGFHCWDTEGSLFFGAGFGDPNPAHGLGLVSEAEDGGKAKSLRWGEGFDPIHPSGSLTLVILCHLSDGEDPRRP